MSASLPYVSGDNLITCTNGGAKWITDNTLATMEIQEQRQHFNIYPNPADEVVFFSLPGKNIASLVEVYSVNGRLLYQEKVQTQSGQINIANLNSGLYIVKATNIAGKIYWQKLIK